MNFTRGMIGRCVHEVLYLSDMIGSSVQFTCIVMYMWCGW